MKISIETVDDDQDRWMLDVIRAAIASSLKAEVSKLCTKVVKAKEAELTALALKELSTVKVTATKSAVKPKGGKRAKV